LGWFRPVHCKSIGAQETRALLTARKLVQVKLHDVEMSLRGILRGFGLKVGPTTPARFERRIRELVGRAGPVGGTCRAAARVRSLREEVLAMARCDTRARLLMSVPGVGAIVSLTFAAAIDDPARFKSSKQVGAYFRPDANQIPIGRDGHRKS
jgi:transposase